MSEIINAKELIEKYNTLEDGLKALALQPQSGGFNDKLIKALSPEPKMNVLESTYADYLQGLLLTEQIKDWKFEPFNLRLASPKCFYKIDFMVVSLSAHIYLVETKGKWIDGDALVKFKVAAETFPYFVFQWVTKDDQKRFVTKTLRDGKWVKSEGLFNLGE